MTRFGRFLRRTHLDELPQVVNMLRGDLSIVGPRPEQPHYVEELVEKLPFYSLRHLVRPGLTGWAQVKYGYAGDERDALEKLQYEFWYLRNQGLLLDARIIGRTVRSVIGTEGRWSMTKPVIMLEFNELSPTLMDRFMGQGKLPGFERLRERSATFVTEAGEAGPLLNPWVQWVTVHTGATAAEHGIRQLGEAHQLGLPTIADVVSASGGAVWLCGSMNVQPIGPINGGILPDPWSVAATPQPSELIPFFRFVSANVQEHTTAANPLSKRETLAFARFLATHGLSLGTTVATLQQLAGERTGRGGRWRRAELLDRFQWDVFRSYYRRIRPTFATFFSNSTAHFQHLYWDEMERAPDTSSVLHGYQQMDRIVEKALALAGDTATVVLCTALSQTANTDADRSREGFYRPCDPSAFVEALDVRGVRDVAPVMAEQMHIFFEDAVAAAEGSRALQSLRSAGEPVFDVQANGNQLFVGCRFFTPRVLVSPLDSLLYWVDAPREGTHHPDGILWIGAGPSPARDVRVPLTSVAPTLLDLLGLEAPASMTGETLTQHGLVP